MENRRCSCKRTRVPRSRLAQQAVNFEADPDGESRLQLQSLWIIPTAAVIGCVEYGRTRAEAQLRHRRQGQVPLRRELRGLQVRHDLHAASTR